MPSLQEEPIMDEAILNSLLKEHAEQEREIQRLREQLADLSLRIGFLEEKKEGA